MDASAAQVMPVLLIGFAAAVVLMLPGLTWQAWFPSKGRDIIERLADAIGLSLAWNATLALVLFLAGVRLWRKGIIAEFALLGVLACWGWLRQRRPCSLGKAEPLALIAFAGLVAWRLYQTRNLALPPWVDAPHHVLIVRKFLEYGGLPPDLSPYLPVTFYYHYTFHSITATFASLSNLLPHQAVLIMGQVLNAAICLSVYRLGKTIWGDQRRAGGAALLVGFVSQMPGYFLTWGRYTLVTGIVLLPLTMAAALETIRQPVGKERVLHMAMITAGLLLSHYFAAFLLALFLVPVGLQRAWDNLRQGSFQRREWTALLAGTTMGIALAGPWLARVWRFSPFPARISTVLSWQAAGQVYFTDYWEYLWKLAGPARGHVLVSLGCVGMLFALVRREARPLGIWGAIIALSCLPIGLHLTPFRPDHFVIILFLPAALLTSDLLFSATRQLSRLFANRRLASITAGLAILGLCLWGATETLDIVNPATVLTTDADQRAMKWIAAHTPPGARFLTNTTIWQDGIYRGLDGGAWVLPLTGRWTLTPTVFYAFGDRGYVSRINQWAEQASHLTSCTPVFWDLVQQAQITHIYVSMGNGTLQPTGLAGCIAQQGGGSWLKLVFQSGGVEIYQVEHGSGGMVVGGRNPVPGEEQQMGGSKIPCRGSGASHHSPG